MTDVADAMLLQRLFGRLWAQGVTCVMTSNRAPHDLYYGGLNRSLFLPFIPLLLTHVDVVHLAGAPDFRQTHALTDAFYYSPLTPATVYSTRNASSFCGVVFFFLFFPSKLTFDTSWRSCLHCQQHLLSSLSSSSSSPTSSISSSSILVPGNKATGTLHAALPRRARHPASPDPYLGTRSSCRCCQWSYRLVYL